MRTAHSVKRSWGWHLPRWIAAVECAGSWEESATQKGARVERLIEWVASIQECKDGRFEREQTAGGRTAEHFWQWLQRQRTGRATVWIFARQCQRILHLLDFWGSLERGWITPLYQHYGGQKGGSVSDSNRGEWGIVLENPPCIIPCIVAESRQRLKFLDMANYGIEGDGSTDRPEDTVADVLGTVRMLVAECRALNLGSFRSTASATAWNGWTANYMDIRPEIHNCPGALQLESESLHGGRTEVYRYGYCVGPVYHCDFKSQYPSVCLSERLPVALVDYRQRSKMADFSSDSLLRNSICSVVLETDEPYYPLRYRGELVFPVGRFRTVLCGPELELAFSLGHVKKTGRVATYERSQVLGSIMAALLDCRARSKNSDARAIGQWSKRSANSLVGCFARRNRVWESVPYSGCHPCWGQWWGSDEEGNYYQYRSLGWNVERMMDYGFSWDAFPAISAWVYSIARMRLLGALTASGLDNCYYSDTDSVFGNAGLLDILSDTREDGTCLPGQLRLEAAYQSAVFYGRKHYSVDGKIVCAGLPQIREREINPLLPVTVNEGVRGSLALGRKPENLLMQRDWSEHLQPLEGRLGRNGRVQPLEVWEK